MAATLLAMPLVVVQSAERAAGRIEVRAALSPRDWMIHNDSARSASLAVLDPCALVSIALKDRRAERAPRCAQVEGIGALD